MLFPEATYCEVIYIQTSTCIYRWVSWPRYMVQTWFWIYRLVIYSMYIHTNDARVCWYVRVCVHTCMYEYVCMCVCVDVCVCVCVCLYIMLWVWVYVCKPACCIITIWNRDGLYPYKGFHFQNNIILSAHIVYPETENGFILYNFPF